MLEDRSRAHPAASEATASARAKSSAVQTLSGAGPATGSPRKRLFGRIPRGFRYGRRQPQAAWARGLSGRGRTKDEQGRPAMPVGPRIGSERAEAGRLTQAALERLRPSPCAALGNGRIPFSADGATRPASPVCPPVLRPRPHAASDWRKAWQAGLPTSQARCGKCCFADSFVGSGSHWAGGRLLPERNDPGQASLRSDARRAS